MKKKTPRDLISPVRFLSENDCNHLKTFLLAVQEKAATPDKRAGGDITAGYRLAFNYVTNSIIPPIYPLLRKLLKPVGYFSRDAVEQFNYLVNLCNASAENLSDVAEEDLETQKSSETIKAPGCPDSVSLSLRFTVFERDGFRCVYCGNGPSDGVQLELDHAMSRADMGPSTEENLVTSCKPCNRGKGSRSVTDA